MNQYSGDRNWRGNLLITSGVILTVLMALLASQIDLLQVPLKPTPSFVAALQPTSVNNSPSDSKLTAVTLPTVTKTPAPTATLSGSPEATAVPMLIRCGEVPEGWTRYEVQATDTLYTISAYAGTTVAAITKVNCIENEFVFEGMIIYLPVRPPTAVPCGPPNWWIRYVVQLGDTLSSLAARTATTVYAIMQANCMDNTYLTAGRTIYLPRYPYTLPPPTRPVIPTATWVPTPTLLPPTPTEPAVTVTAVTPSPTAIITTTVTATPIPSVTGTATATPNATLSPTPINTATPVPATATSLPTNTPTPLPTATAVPPPTNTPVPPPTNTPIPPSTNTPVPPPSATP